MIMDLFRKLKYCPVLFFTAVILLNFIYPCFANENKKIRVAFPQVEGFTQTAGDGTRKGLIIDYLNEISKYTGWEYEYVDTTSNEIVNDFLAGKFDLMGGTYYSSEFEKYFAYPKYNCGYVNSVLFARSDDDSVEQHNPHSINGKKIGVYGQAKENIKRLNEFLSANSLDCEVIEYPNESLSEEGNLYHLLENKEVDLLLGNATEKNTDFKIVCSFKSQPHYIVTTSGNDEILDELNSALKKIIESNPRFAQECYDKNFPSNTINNIHMNYDELEYVKRKKVVVVAIPKYYHPFYCMYDNDGSHNGLVPDVLNKVSDFSGLEFQYVYVENYEESLEFIKNGKADIAGFFIGTEEEAAEKGLATTNSYVRVNNILVRNKNVSYPQSGLTAAVLNGRVLPKEIEAKEVKYYDDLTDALYDVDNEKVDFLVALSPRIEMDMQNNYFSNVVPVTLSTSMEVGFALARPVEPHLLTIINKALNNLSNEEKKLIETNNIISVGSSQNFSLKSLIYANPILFVCVIAVILGIIIIVILFIEHERVRAAVMKNNLEKAEAESKAKGVFLSRMSHEIRTPMNVVVGLADITSMAENIPEGIRSNLYKIRSSAHYLLRLINDILDMSRIDNGMLTISKEPFNIESMLDEVESMMSAEAQRKGLDLVTEFNIKHSIFCGDAIRLRQVITNLLSNAIKFTDNGGKIRLGANETEFDDKGATFEFYVIDNGVGISSNDQKRIFEAFEQAGTNYYRSQGTGLGLAISSAIVKAMGSNLNLNSEEGKGSNFYFNVYLDFGTMEEKKKFEKDIIYDELLENAKLLLAEDNELNAEIATQILQIRGAVVKHVKTGKQAVEIFSASKENEYRAILMDIKMPEMDGLQAAKCIRKLERKDSKTVPIIAMTANSFKEDIDAAIEAGMDEFITKPLDINYFYSVLQRILQKTE